MTMNDGLLDQPAICLDADDTQPAVHQLTSGSCALFSKRCPEKETPNEDAAAVIPVGPNAAVLAVADGCGGMAGGDRAARLAIEAITESLTRATQDDLPLRVAILDGIEHANRAVRDLGIGAATTLSVVEIEDLRIRPYHVGDCLIMLVGNRGKIKLQTRSHSPVGYAVAAGVLDETDAIHHDDRHLVSNVIGSEDTHIEVGPHRRMAQRDTLLIASDGLVDNLHTDEIVELIRKDNLPSAANRLATAASERMKTDSDTKPSKPDDLTFLLFRQNRRNIPSEIPSENTDNTA